MTTGTTSDEMQATLKMFQSIDESALGSQEVRARKSLGLSPLNLERSESAEFVDKLLQSGASENLQSGSSLNSKRLHALFLSSMSKSMDCSRGTTFEPLKTSTCSSTSMNEIPDLNSNTWLPTHFAIDNDAISTTLFHSEVLPQNHNHLQSHSLDAGHHEPNRIGGTNWFQLLDNVLPPAQVSPSHSTEADSTRIPRESFPSTSRKRPYKCRRPEPECKVFFQVRDVDVLLGRGGRVNHHPGNRRYLRQKEAMQERYLTAEKNHKKEISQELVDTVHAWGGRFLQLEEGTEDSWFEVLNRVAREKASQTLREMNTAENRAAKRAKYAKKPRKWWTLRSEVHCLKMRTANKTNRMYHFTRTRIFKRVERMSKAKNIYR